MDPDEWDPSESTFVVHMIAGAFAGTAEHTGMFPFDTIKTHLQTERGKPSGAIVVGRQLVEKNGVTSLFRGLPAVAGGAIPAHAVYFSVYEGGRAWLGADRHDYFPLRTGLASMFATVLHDGILSPWDVTKQRMQLRIKPYRNVLDCLNTVYRTEGIKALYAGYTTSLTMNIPYHFTHVSTYEMFRRFLSDDPDAYEPLNYSIAGGMAGMCAAAATNPLDVTKTRLQTMGDTGKQYSGMKRAMAIIYQEEGYVGFLRGLGPRVLFHSTAAAMCWSVYEGMKKLLRDRV